MKTADIINVANSNCFWVFLESTVLGPFNTLLEASASIDHTEYEIKTAPFILPLVIVLHSFS